MMRKYLCMIFCALIAAVGLWAQPVQQLVDVQLTPNHADWRYRLGEQAVFELKVLQNNVPLSNVEVQYEYGKETLKPDKKETRLLSDGTYTIKAGTLREPGFLRCRVTAIVNGKKYTGLCTAAYEPEKIEPTVEMPKDFWEFWGEALEANAQIPLEPQMTLQPDMCTDKVNVYHVSMQSYRYGSRIYGWLAMPAKEGKYPAILRVPGAGVWKNGPDMDKASKGFIVLSIGIHGIPLTLPNENYEILRKSALWCYWTYGIHDKDNFYYKRVYMGCVSAIEFLTRLPEYDGENLGVFGDSQGGALATITASLDKRVKAYVAYYPALCDLTGYLYGRAGGWPHYFKNKDLSSRQVQLLKENTAYYDVVNFARSINVPCLYSWGFNDETCPPTSFYCAYNVIESDKQAIVYQEIGHWRYPEQREIVEGWLMKQLSKDKTN